MDAPFDALGQQRAWPTQPDLHGDDRRVRTGARPEAAERTTTAEAHLQRANEPAGVARLDPSRGGRVKCGEAGVQIGWVVGVLRQLRADLRPLPRQRQPVDDRREVETGAGHEQRCRATTSDVVQ